MRPIPNRLSTVAPIYATALCPAPKLIEGIVQPFEITIKSPISERRQSIVEVLRLAVNILGAGKRRRGAHQQLLGPGGLLHGVVLLAVGKRLLGQ